MYKIVIMNIKEFLNKKFLEWQYQEEQRKTIKEFAGLFGTSKSLMAMWMNGTRSPGPEYKERIIERYGEEAILAFGEDPGLYKVNQRWQHLSQDLRNSILELSDHNENTNHAKRTSTERRTRTIK